MTLCLCDVVLLSALSMHTARASHLNYGSEIFQRGILERIKARNNPQPESSQSSLCIPRRTSNPASVFIDAEGRDIRGRSGPGGIDIYSSNEAPQPPPGPVVVHKTCTCGAPAYRFWISRYCTDLSYCPHNPPPPQPPPDPFEPLLERAFEVAERRSTAFRELKKYIEERGTRQYVKQFKYYERSIIKRRILVDTFIEITREQFSCLDGAKVYMLSPKNNKEWLLWPTQYFSQIDQLYVFKNMEQRYAFPGYSYRNFMLLPFLNLAPIEFLNKYFVHFPERVWSSDVHKEETFESMINLLRCISSCGLNPKNKFKYIVNCLGYYSDVTRYKCTDDDMYVILAILKNCSIDYREVANEVFETYGWDLRPYISWVDSRPRVSNPTRVRFLINDDSIITTIRFIVGYVRWVKTEKDNECITTELATFVE